MSTDRARLRLLLALLASAGAGAGCTQQMATEGKIAPLEHSELFEDGRSARTPVQGTVARGHLRENDHLYTGMVDGRPATTFPMPTTLDLLHRGRERYEIFCAPCHDRVGNGNGVVVQRGFRRPSSFHVERLREAVPGYFFDVMSNGFGAMSSYAAQVPARDRWAIVAYIRALQLSQRAAADRLQSQDLEALGGDR